MPAKKLPNYEGCNHRLTRSAIRTAQDMDENFGNAGFDWREELYNAADVALLEEQRFLIPAHHGKVRRNKIIIGELPTRRK